LRIGTPIVQPASPDPDQADVIGEVVFVNTTEVDCALVSLTARAFKPRSLFVWDDVDAPAVTFVGHDIWKIGASTLKTGGTVLSTNKTVLTPCMWQEILL
jgi:hypothetical protein